MVLIFFGLIFWLAGNDKKIIIVQIVFGIGLLPLSCWIYPESIMSTALSRVTVGDIFRIFIIIILGIVFLINLFSLYFHLREHKGPVGVCIIIISLLGVIAYTSNNSPPMHSLPSPPILLSPPPQSPVQKPREPQPPVHLPVSSFEKIFAIILLVAIPCYIIWEFKNYKKRKKQSGD